MESVRANLEEFGQCHLLQFFNELSDSEKELLLKDINDINIKETTGYFKAAINSPTQEKLDGLLQPVPDELLGSATHSNAEALAELEDIGLLEISESAVGVLLLAGGQGTRLGLNYPKGMHVYIHLPT